MTKEELEQYRSMVAEIDEIRDRLNSHTVHGTVTGSDSEFPYVQHVMSVGGVTETEANQRDMLLIRRLERQKQDIEQFIQSIPDSELRRIFTYKYINGPYKTTWIAVVKKIYPNFNIDKQFRMKESIKKKCMRFLKKV